MIKERPLILIGGGGHCKSVIDAAISSGRIIKGILDKPQNVGGNVFSFDIIGSDDDIDTYVNDCDFIVTVGSIKDSSLREKLHRKVINSNGKLGIIIASTAYVSPYATIGSGTVILHHAIINAGALLGMGCIINTSAVIEHDSLVGDFTHISTGSMVNGTCSIGRSCFIGSNSTINNNIILGDSVIVGSGSVVIRNVASYSTIAGNPAHSII